jgi:hypothetical protein
MSLALIFALAAGPVHSSAVVPVSEFMKVCVGSQVMGPEETYAASMDQGWRYDESLDVADSYGSSIYFRHPQHRGLLLENLSFGGSIKFLVPPDVGGGGRGGAVQKENAIQSQIHKADARAALTGRLQPADGLSEFSCAITTDVDPEILIRELTMQLGFSPNASKSISPTVWVFNRSGVASIARPEILPTRRAILDAANRSGPLHTISISRTELDRIPRHIVRYTHYMTSFSDHRSDPTLTGQAASEFRRVCMNTGADPVRARSASSLYWSRYQNESLNLTDGTEAYTRGLENGLLFIKDLQVKDASIGEFNSKSCIVQFNYRLFEEVVEDVVHNVGSEPDFLPYGIRQWYFRGSVSKPVILATHGTSASASTFRAWMDTYGAFYSLRVTPSSGTGFGNVSLVRYSR